MSESPPSRDAEGGPAVSQPGVAGFAGDASSPEQELDPEQLLAELRQAKVSDLLAQTCSLLASLGYAKLAPETRDLEQARLAIEALKALGPLLEEEPARDVRQVVSNLQLAFAGAASGK